MPAERVLPAVRLRAARLGWTCLLAALLSGCASGSGAEPIYQGSDAPGPSASTEPAAGISPSAAPADGTLAGTDPAGTDSAGTDPAGTDPADGAPGAPASGPAALPAVTYAGDEVTGLGVPWSIAVLPDGTLLFSDRETGDIMRAAADGTSLVGTLPDAAEASGEGGLLGLAVAGDFSDNPAVYAYYTSSGDNRVVRMSYEDNALGEPEEILTGIPKGNIHNGGRIAFGPDSRLYIGTGDAGNGSNAQDPESLGGKVLRLAPDGTVPTDNPTPGSPVYSRGHRNVQGLAWDSEERLWATEFGPEVDDELNLVVPGSNYGWPDVTGAPGRQGFVDAQVAWPSTATSSPSGMAIIDDTAYIGGLRGQRLWQVPLVGGQAGRPVSHFDGEFGRLRDVAEGSDGLLVVTNEGDGGARILRATLD
ncbi:PQQ-dependent sugar dehydrogenase [Arthrobacter sp. Br18]|uniref:PQQ-dependent sugar dehydrogenase n=1 Tax=Arthrobacter sp. Br18 TaxID=1312954 RepID=UPI0004B3958E|nr:PQQ-dependent sugar dehydrogenase [Arthrobacter sp. Br18]